MFFRRTKKIFIILSSVLFFVIFFWQSRAQAGWLDDVACIGIGGCAGLETVTDAAIQNAVDAKCKTCEQQSRQCVVDKTKILDTIRDLGYSWPDFDSVINDVVKCQLLPGDQQQIELSELGAELSARKPIPRISIPGLNFSNVMSSTEDSGVYFYIPWIPELISALYKFGIAAVSIIAVVVIILQGVRVITSAGGEAKQSAYKKILQSVIGLAIAWGSFAILYNVNPNLIQFNALRVKVVERIELEEKHECDDPSECGYQTDAPTETIPKGTFTSDLALAQKNRAAPIDYKYFGQVDYTIKRTRKLQDIKRFVIHNGGYTAQMNVDVWLGLFRKTGKKTGTHYTIDRGGVIYQMIGEEAVASHANAFNSDSIGVELNISKANGKSCNSLDSATKEAVLEACSPTEAQYQSLNLLIQDIISRTGLKLDKNNIVGHCEVGPKAHGDPRAFDWGRIGLNNQDKKQMLSSGKTACSWYLPF